MVVFIEGVKIELTEGQVAKIEKRKKQLQKSFISFSSVLRHFGFRQLKEQKESYQKGNWHAEILDRGNWHEVWMTGEGLKEASGFPGGWLYSDPRELNDELSSALAQVK